MDNVKPLFGLGLIVALCALVLDRLSKWWIIDIVGLPNIQVVKILPIFNLQWAENRGVSFSFLSTEGDLTRWALVVATALIVVGFGFWLKNSQTKLPAVAIGLVIGGALGNIYDRVVFGYVADFLHFFMGDWSFAIFNVADSCITIGAGLLIWDNFFGETSQKHQSG